MAGNLLDYDEVRTDLVEMRTDLDTIGQQLHDAKHHHEGIDRENIAAAADDVMQAWAKVTAASANLDAFLQARAASRRARMLDTSVNTPLGSLFA